MERTYLSKVISAKVDLVHQDVGGVCCPVAHEVSFHLHTHPKIRVNTLDTLVVDNCIYLV